MICLDRSAGTPWIDELWDGTRDVNGDPVVKGVANKEAALETLFNLGFTMDVSFAASQQAMRRTGSLTDDERRQLVEGVSAAIDVSVYTRVGQNLRYIAPLDLLNVRLVEMIKAKAIPLHSNVIPNGL